MRREQVLVCSCCLCSIPSLVFLALDICLRPEWEFLNLIHPHPNLFILPIIPSPLIFSGAGVCLFLRSYHVCHGLFSGKKWLQRQKASVMDGEMPREFQEHKHFLMHIRALSCCPHQQEWQYPENHCCLKYHHHRQARTLIESVLENCQNVVKTPGSQ